MLDKLMQGVEVILLSFVMPFLAVSAGMTIWAFCAIAFGW